MGTPEFAVPALQKLHAEAANKDWEVIAVATQPDRRAGRGKKMVVSPVKEFAVQHEIPVLQPEKYRKAPDAVTQLQALQPDLIVVAAYGLILPKAVLEIPTFGALNIHASILPAYRGASPIYAALLAGLEETGISIMLMDRGLDTGPVLAQSTYPITPEDTTEQLSAALAQQGASLLLEILPSWLAGEIAPIVQDELPGEPSYCTIIKKEEGRIDWQQPAYQIERMVRAYAPWPSAFTTWQESPFKIWQATVVPGKAEPGQVLLVDQQVAVGTGEGLLVLESVQPAGKRAMESRSFLNGTADFVGSVLG